MRRIMTWLLSTISALVLLFSYHTSTSAAGASTVIAQGTEGTASNGSAPNDSGPTTSGSTDSGSTTTGSTDSGPTTSGSAPSRSTAPPPAPAKSYTGQAVSTEYGDVQVRITVKQGRITAAKVTKVPWTDHKDQEINGYAVPILNKEAVSSQSASIDMVSGASYTSQGYMASLQSAIDQAHL
ncbi:MAG: FMN-binding protein [Ornithinibacter sp.]